MQLEIYQWAVPLVALFFISRAIQQYRHNRRHLNSMLIWVAFWIFICAVAIVPNSISIKLAKILGIKDNVNAVIFAGMGILYFLVFQISSSLARLETQLTELVREDAKKKAEHPEKFS